MRCWMICDVLLHDESSTTERTCIFLMYLYKCTYGHMFGHPIQQQTAMVSLCYSRAVLFTCSFFTRVGPSLKDVVCQKQYHTRRGILLGVS